jgi:hypothetical protein
MAIDKEDIKEGWYWVRNRERPLGLSIVRIVDTFGSISAFYHGWDTCSSIHEAIGKCDFIARVEPPEGV